MFCFMMMTTIKPGSPTIFETQGHGTLKSYEMKILQADSEQALLDEFIKQAEFWLIEHPDREALEITEFSVNHLILRYPKLVQYDGTAEFDLPNVFHFNYECTAPNGYSCVISSNGCWGYSFLELKFAINDANILPYTPGHFDSVAIESAEAFSMLRGELSGYANPWNRMGWEMKYGIDEVPGFIEQINAELDQIAHNPYVKSFSLKYFEGIH